ncbi:hypothetical protein KBY66_03770 [Synechococcus sp. Tobar12-5m-g]|uniref:hypothetical protein n=1 Tax=unclassified Synechococcus TaxID=2626047 RepID=UPI0020CF2ECF|nr:MULTISPECIES: hypothetical protein [unclassified Synechococcus]MCP9771744.1 hypothetical protein [Synechococcus sp. Tobar12-5m-g]MCP9872686.1 hypothetical protein [Synechococcus sp. Cruz CV-v-12]
MAYSHLGVRSLLNASKGRLYRLVDQQCSPHPVLDDHFESMDAAWEAALDWWQKQVGAVEQPIGIGIEVSTPRGDWRTLRYPGTWPGLMH